MAEALSRLPEPLRAEVGAIWADLSAAHPGFPAAPEGCPDWREALARVWAGSEFVSRSCRQHPEVLAGLIESGDLFREYDAGEPARRAGAAVRDCATAEELKHQLRVLRRREMLRIAWRDLAGWADLSAVMADLSGLAEGCVDAALARLEVWARGRAGTPRAVGGAPARFVVLGMGKLGGGELNFSSDIDLIFAYDEDGETDGTRTLSNHEYFLRLGQELIATLNDATADGFVFRVDMRLRPNGQSGPLALSFEAMEYYYQTHGRMWERYAWIKARAVGGDRAAGAELLARLKPFVYRRYLDYSAVEEVRSLKGQIDRELRRKGMEHNIKLGPGGIREIEFIAQCLQLIRGGREPALQDPRLRPVLARLGADGYLTPRAVDELNAAYEFLRRTEHRLQMLDDRQTHVLPEDELARLRVAAAMSYGGWAEFVSELERHRRRVQGHFELSFSAPQVESGPAAAQSLLGVWQEALDPAAAGSVLAARGYRDPASARALLRGLREGGAYEALSAEGRERLDRLMPLLIAAAGLAPDPAATLARAVKLIEAIGRRPAYFSLLIENPLVLSQLVRLIGASAWIADWIALHPVLLDELMNPLADEGESGGAELEAELAQRLAQLPAEDLEAQMEALREFRHGQVLRVAAADLAVTLGPQEVGRRLSLIAEAVIRQTLGLARDAMVARHGEPRCRDAARAFTPGFAVIAYGKLGSREFGYGSDLDMLYLFESCPGPEPAQTGGARPVPIELFFARLGQRLIHLLTTRTPAGILYEVDMRLRPSGRAGTLVTSLAAYRDYQLTTAWTWEHQALVRARPVAGDAALGAAFEAVRAEVLRLARDPEKLRNDVAAMRRRMAEARPAREPGRFDLKHDRGGMIDLEFMVQYWVLRWAHTHPALTRSTDNIHLLEALRRSGVLDEARCALLVEAYRRYLSAEQRLKLMERRPLVEPAEVGDFPPRVAALWHETIDEENTGNVDG